MQGGSLSTCYQTSIDFGNTLDEGHESVQKARLSFITSLPCFLNPSTWKRHKYAVPDIRKTLRAYPVRYLWKLALTLGILPSASSIRLGYSFPGELVFGAKAGVIAKILMVLKPVLDTIDRPITRPLSYVETDDCPSLPGHKVPPFVYTRLLQTLPEQEGSIFNYKTITNPIIRWRSIDIAPLRLERSLSDTLEFVRCVRIVPEADYVQQRPTLSMAQQPWKFIHQATGHKYCGTDEEILFVLSKFSNNCTGRDFDFIKNG